MPTEINIEPSQLQFSDYPIIGVGIVLLVGTRLCLQHRTPDARSFPDALSQWGGDAEKQDASPRAAACRELGEEILSYAQPRELIFLGAFGYRPASGPASLALRYFAAVEAHRYKGCREGQAARFFKTAAEALCQPKLHRPGTEWALQTCIKRGLIS